MLKHLGYSAHCKLARGDFVQWITPLPIRKKDQNNCNTLLSLIVVDTPPGVYPPRLCELAKGTPGDSLKACIN
jgi:hypothetical protein